jgi:hypothetical protein
MISIYQSSIYWYNEKTAKINIENNEERHGKSDSPNISQEDAKIIIEWRCRAVFLGTNKNEWINKSIFDLLFIVFIIIFIRRYDKYLVKIELIDN